MARKKSSVLDDEGPAAAAASQGGVGKSKKKVVIDDDEYSLGTHLSEETMVQDEQVVTFAEKKGKKGNSKNSKRKDDDSNDSNDEKMDDDLGGKNSSKAKKGGSNTSVFSASSFGLLGEDDNDNNGDGDDDEGQDVGKKKSFKWKKGASVVASSAFDVIGDDDGVFDETVVFSGEKKPSKSNKKLSSFHGLDEEEENKEENQDDYDDVSTISFSGKKKSSKLKKKGNSFDAEENDEDASVSKLGSDGSDEDASAILFSGKKKSSKKNSNSTFSGLEAGMGDDSVEKIETEQLSVGMSIKQVSKNKKKKKKGGRTAQEEDDLDKILAEFGETPSISKPEEEIAKTDANTQGEKEVEEGGVETAAAKKKRKKKEKEKEKKAALAPIAEEKKEETKGKVTDKKAPKHVREMQERLAKLKEAEEKKKREEEEKFRKEEEERIRLEELKRQAEEKKRLRKEREKEKLLKKKLEGKPLTAKQKEEARRREAMRNQILANAGGLPLPSADIATGPTKRVKYQAKKSKAHAENQEIATRLEILEPDKVEEAELIDVDEKETEEEIIEDEWDAKSWDLKLPGKSAFGDEDEEIDSEPEPLAIKEIKSAQPAVQKVMNTPVETKKSEHAGEKTNKVIVKEEVAKGEEDLRSPICCIMGHVDTGKTKLLDCIRGTNVQEGEAGGITQQIGATYFPAQNIRDRTKELKADAKLKVPGLLVIDTPGHESFTNLRSRGSGLCDIAVLVVDIMHGLEPQTIESLNLLKMRNTEFIVALNKVDRLFGWKTLRNAPIVEAMKHQPDYVKLEFNTRLTHVITQFKEQGLNTELYYRNKEMGETYSIVPTSAISGEGIPDLLLLLVQWTQKTMVKKLTYSHEMQCTVLEVKIVEGHGTTIDVVLVNGTLHEGDQIVVCGMQGPIVTTIRALLTPHPMKELRVKGTYLHHKEIKAAQGIKITAQGLEHAIAGTGLYVVKPDDELETIKESAMEDMRSVMSRIGKSGEGVCVQASTLGSLEALLEFLKTPAVNIPVSGIGIGPVHKKDVMKASVMLEKKKEYATILAFDVKVTPEARELADEVGVNIVTADTIYRLVDQFEAYIHNLNEEKKKEAAQDAVFPCVLRIIPDKVFNNKDPIVLGVDIIEGIAKIGTPICIPQKDFIDIGQIASIENNRKPLDCARKGQKVAIKIIGSNSEEQQKMFGRHFDIEDELVSHISRRSIDILKTYYRDELNKDEWSLVVKLKKLFKIQ